MPESDRNLLGGLLGGWRVFLAEAVVIAAAIVLAAAVAAFVELFF
ncbi:MAG: hypothetical protein ACE5E8_11515 [Acidimicrobiia bacterium]